MPELHTFKLTRDNARFLSKTIVPNHIPISSVRKLPASSPEFNSIRLLICYQSHFSDFFYIFSCFGHSGFAYCESSAYIPYLYIIVYNKNVHNTTLTTTLCRSWQYKKRNSLLITGYWE